MANEAPQGRPLDGELQSASPAETDPSGSIQPGTPAAAEIPVKPGAEPGPQTAPGTETASPSDYTVPGSPEPGTQDSSATGPESGADRIRSEDPAYTGYPPYGVPAAEPSAATPDASTVPGSESTTEGYGQGVPRQSAAVPAPEPEDAEEEGGGPVKPFLDHLEDLRWTLIKVVVSVLLGMLVCLIAGNKLVAFLTWPLEHAQRMLPAAQQRIPLLLGTNEIGRVQMGSVHLPPGVHSNTVSALELMPEAVDGRWLLALSIQTNRNPSRAEANLVTLKNYGPISAFMVALKLALYGGLVLASPFVIFFTGQYVLPALKVREKSYLYRIAGMGSVLFLVGIAFCYLVIVQVALMASVQFSQWMGFGADEWRAEEYISFVCKFMLGMGLSFQLPLVILTLVKIGILDHETLSKYRAYFIVGNLVVSAVVTPSGDPLTMVLMALPLQFLYEVSLLVARYWARKDREQEAADG